MLEFTMSINNSDINDLLTKAIAAGKPPVRWYKRWWDKLLYNLKITFRLTIVVFVLYCIGQFAYDNPVTFMAFLAALS